MEGAERLIATATALQREILSDYIDEVVTPTNLFNDVLRDVVSHDSPR
jgi:hypothetical protein